MATQVAPEAPKSGNDARRLGRLQIASATLFLVAAGSFVLTKCIVSPEISFVVHDPNSPWIMYPTRVSTMGMVTKPDDVPKAQFLAHFRLPRVPQSAEVRIRAMREFELHVNDQLAAVSRAGPHSWKKKVRVDITRYLKEAENEIRVDVHNPWGPPLLNLVTIGLPDSVWTDEAWRVQLGSAPMRPAIVAEDMKTLSESQTEPTAMESLRQEKTRLAVVFLCSATLFLAGNRWGGARALATLPWLTLGGLTMLWLGPLAIRAKQLPVDAGFDAFGHLDYIRFILNTHTIPLATDGWSMYHPPLFHLLAAWLLEFIGRGLDGAQALDPARAIPLICGIAHITVAAVMTRKLFPGTSTRLALATLMAGIIPMNIYVSMYISNESPSAFFAGCAILGTVWMLMAPQTSARMSLATGVCMGMALLTKFTALLLVPVACFFVGAKVLLAEKKSFSRAMGSALLMLVGALVVSGWYYVRNVAEFGYPMVVNWDLPGKPAALLQWPGFHTPAYYLAFGEALRHPYFSGFHSFWDGIYSTFWGDGYLAGESTLRTRLPIWNYHFMSSTYLLALPATVLGCIGALRAMVMALKDANLRVRLALSFLLAITAVVLSATAYYTLKVPVYSTVKAFYGLMLLGPLAVFLALGFEEVERHLLSPRLLIIRAGAYGWLGALVAAVYLSYVG